MKRKVENNMSKADEMFEKLGYKKIESKSKIIFVKDCDSIDFLLQYKKIEYSFLRGTIFKVQNMQELQAINEKVKELGWNENN
jgi:hypothetical protein